MSNTKNWENVEFSKAEMERYSRHLILPEVGLEGQKKLKAASVLCVGTGGLGSPLTMYLAAAGVGRLGIVDFDVVDESNLHRQILHGVDDIGKPKLDSAERKIKQINPFVEVIKHETRLTSDNAMEIIKDYDLVADGTDNFPTRYLVNDACVLSGKPNVYASIFRFEGQVSVFGAPGGPDYRDLYPEPPPPGLVPSCAEGGVLGILPGIVGTLQATEVIKMITGIGEPLIGKLLLIDALKMSFRTLKLRKDPENPLSGQNPSIKEPIDYEFFCGIPQAKAAEEKERSAVKEMTVQELKASRDKGEKLFVLDVRKPYEAEIAAMGADQLIPVELLADRLDELKAPKNEVIVVHCRSGARSARAVAMLKEAGFEKAINLEGGILAWAEYIDPSIPKY
ncbi:MAG: molybdopterin-synthase adenylyltransferase MoeB [Myxococcales bacterium]|nr:MAG: molybdopterin-synthase adenylyltransferase MoeB [Myxococcales bacterium]